MSFIRSKSLFVILLGAAVCSAASLLPRYEDNAEVSADTGNVRVVDSASNVTAADVCSANQALGMWPNLQTHISRALDYVNPNTGEGCHGAHLASRLMDALNRGAVRQVTIGEYGEETGLLELSSFQYFNTLYQQWQWCATKTLWNDFGTGLGQQLNNIASIAANPPWVILPPTGSLPTTLWAFYTITNIQNICVDVIGNTQVGMLVNPGMLACITGTGDRVVSNHLIVPDNICVRVALGQSAGTIYAATCFPVGVYNRPGALPFDPVVRITGDYCS